MKAVLCLKVLLPSHGMRIPFPLNHPAPGVRCSKVLLLFPSPAFLFFLLLKKIFKLILWEREREKEGKHWCESGSSIGCPLHTLYQGWSLQPDRCPDQESKRHLSVHRTKPKQRSHTSQGTLHFCRPPPSQGHTENEHFLFFLGVPLETALIFLIKFTAKIKSRKIWCKNHLKFH